jgi:hypothetical protein
MGLTRRSLSSCLAVREHAPLVVAALLSAVLAGCGEENRESSALSVAPEFTQIAFEAQLPDSPFASDIASMHVQIVGPPQAGTTVPLTRQGDVWKGSVIVPTTEEGYYFVGRAFNASHDFLFQSVNDTPPAGPDGLLSVVLPFELRTPLPFTQIEFEAQLPPSPFASEIASVHVQITVPSAGQTIVTLSKQGDTWKGSARVPVTPEGYYFVGRALTASTEFLFDIITHVPPAGPDGLLNVFLPFQIRTPLPFIQLDFHAQLPQDARASEVTSVDVEVVGPPPARSTVALTRNGDAWTGSVRVPPVEGSYALVGRAFNASTQFLFDSVVSVPAVTPDGLLPVTLPFQPRTP